MPKTDPELVAETLRGDEDAFEEIVRRYQRFVFNAIYHYLGYNSEAEDVAQEIFLKLFRSLDRYDQSRPLQAWIYRISVNHCLDEMRKARHRFIRLFSDMGEEEEDRIKYLFEKSSKGSPFGESEEAESFKLLHRLLDKLSARDKMTFVLREVEGRSYDDIAATLGTSPTAVRIRLSRVKRKLLKRLEGVLDSR